MATEMSIEEARALVWNYHQMEQEDALQRADLIWVLGSHDLRVADRAVDLWKEGLAGEILMSGGLGNFTAGVFEKPEAELLAERAAGLGVPREALLIENRSANTGENVRFSRQLLEGKGRAVNSVIAVQKPYMERRTYATIRAQWPELRVQVTSPRLDFPDYCVGEMTADEVTHIMVGDLQRIWEYPKRGFMIEQDVPGNVRQAFLQLVEAGYDRHLLR